MIINFKRDDSYGNFKSTDGKYWLCKEHLVREHPELRTRDKFKVEISLGKQSGFREAKVTSRKPKSVYDWFIVEGKQYLLSGLTTVALVQLCKVKRNIPFWYKILME